MICAKLLSQREIVASDPTAPGGKYAGMTAGEISKLPSKTLDLETPLEIGSLLGMY